MSDHTPEPTSDEIIELAAQYCSDRERALRWFHTDRIELFEFRSPAEMVAAGLGRAVWRYVGTLESGCT